MRPSRAIVLGVLAGVLAVVLAGCATSEAAGGADAAADPSKGRLRGIVVDDAIRPIAGATVNITGQGVAINLTTDERGSFLVPDLEPGAYLVRVSKEFYAAHEQAVTVSSGVLEPELARFQLVFEPGSIPYSEIYQFEGLFECGFAVPGYSTGGCANVNIVTGVMLCSYNLPCFNVTGDRSVELIWIARHPDFIQSELVWTPTTETGRALEFGLGAGTWQELQDGFVDSYNYTWGESPLMLQLHGADLEESRIGIDNRSLLIQIHPAWTFLVPVCSDVQPNCGFGAHAQQPYRTYTHAFYGYAPPAEWRFATDGPPPPPA